MQSERRQGARKAYDEWVELHSDGVRRRGTGFDLSPGGIGVEIEAVALDASLPIVCEFPIPGIQIPIEIPGAIAWRDGSRLGIRFADIDPGIAELLESYVAGQL